MRDIPTKPDMERLHAEAAKWTDWFARCYQCGVELRGTLVELLEHQKTCPGVVKEEK